MFHVQRKKKKTKTEPILRIVISIKNKIHKIFQLTKLTYLSGKTQKVVLLSSEALQHHQ